MPSNYSGNATTANSSPSSWKCWAEMRSRKYAPRQLPHWDFLSIKANWKRSPPKHSTRWKKPCWRHTRMAEPRSSAGGRWKPWVHRHARRSPGSSSLLMPTGMTSGWSAPCTPWVAPAMTNGRKRSWPTSSIRTTRSVPRRCTPPGSWNSAWRVPPCSTCSRTRKTWKSAGRSSGPCQRSAAGGFAKNWKSFSTARRTTRRPASWKKPWTTSFSRKISIKFDLVRLRSGRR